MDASPSVSFIGIVDFTEDAKWVYCSESVQDLLGFEPRELLGHPSLDLVHPDELHQVRAIHYSTITQDQAAVLAYLRMRHKDPCRGYILCAISRTVCQNVLVGSVSFASPGPKALHNAATAQEITVITPTAKDFEFRRWGDPSPMPPCPVPPELMISRPGSPPAPPNASPMRFDPLPEQSVRTALILNRFSTNCDIQYCANDSVLDTTHALGRSFFDFVVKRDEQLVRSWIDVVKGWGVNERGQPSDGGFGYGKFSLLVDGRDHNDRSAEISPVLRQRQGSHRHASAYQPRSRTSPDSDCLRDMAAASAAAPAPSSSRGRDYMRELTRELPADAHLPLPPLPRPHSYSQSHSTSYSHSHAHTSSTRHTQPLPFASTTTSTSSFSRLATTTSSSNSRSHPPELLVDAIFSAHSDGLVVIIRRSETDKFTPVHAPPGGALPTTSAAHRPGSGGGRGSGAPYEYGAGSGSGVSSRANASSGSSPYVYSPGSGRY